MDFDQTTLTEAFGEYMFGCVSTVARRLNVSGEFASPTIIRAKLTEYITHIGEPTSTVKDAMKDNKTSGNRIKIEF